MKLLVTAALGLALASGCSSSDDDGPTPTNDTNANPTTEGMPGTDGAPGTNTEMNTDTDTDAGTGTATGTGTDTDTGTNTDTGTDTGGPTATGPALDASFADLIVALGAYEADTAPVRVIALADIATSTALASRSTAGSEVPVSSDEGASSLTTTATEHDCALGGRFVTEEAQSGDSLTDSSTALAVNVYRFEDCRLSDGNGETVVGGELAMTSVFARGSRADDSRREHRWTDFSIASADGSALEIDGLTAYAAYNDTNVNNSSRTVALTRYVESTDSATERLDNISFELVEDAEGSGLYRTFGLDVSGTVTGAATGGAAVTVETVSPLSRVRRSDATPDDPLAAPFTGALLLRSAGGDVLTVNARDTDTDELFVDLDYVGADGETRQGENVAFPVLDVPSPNDVQEAVVGN